MKDMFIYKNGRFVLAEAKPASSTGEYHGGPVFFNAGHERAVVSGSATAASASAPAPAAQAGPEVQSPLQASNLYEFLKAIFPGEEYILRNGVVDIFFNEYEAWCKENKLNFDAGDIVPQGDLPTDGHSYSTPATQSTATAAAAPAPALADSTK